MYRHLLVPIDDTDASVDIVASSVALARVLEARITFLHVVPPHACAQAGQAATPGAAQADRDCIRGGRSRELMARAEAAARALGVPCDAAQAAGQPAASIVAAALARRCDLIFMASHGSGSGLAAAAAAETLSVLTSAAAPVLLSSAIEPRLRPRAIDIIRDEHRSLATVLHAWLLGLSRARAGAAAPDLRLMRAILCYLRDFPAALHHPKEERHLFRRLRERSESIGLELDELERQHARDGVLVAALARRVDALAAAGRDGEVAAQLAELDSAVQDYAMFLWEHIGREEGVILPAAQRLLSSADWADIDAAFERDRDPGAGGASEAQFRRLCACIVDAAEGGR